MATVTADTSRVRIRFVAEGDATKWGETPNNAALQVARLTGETMSVERATTTSEEIRDDRQIPDSIPVRETASGDLTGEISYGSYDAFFESAMYNSFAAFDDTGSVTIDNPDGWLVNQSDHALNDDDVEVDTGSGGNPRVGDTFVVAGDTTVYTVTAYASNIIDYTPNAKTAFADNAAITFNEEETRLVFSAAKSLVLGQIIDVSGFTGTSTRNARMKVLKKLSTTSYLVSRVDGTAITGTATAANARVRGDALVNGTTQKSFSMDKTFQDVSETIYFRGMVASGFTLTLPAEEKIMVTFPFMGLKGDSADYTGTTTQTNATTTDIMNSADHVATLKETGDDITSITNMTIELANGLRNKPAVSSLEGVGIGTSRANVSGSLSVYFTNQDLYEKFLDNEDVDILMELRDAAGNSYYFNLPRVKVTAMNIQAGGTDQDVISEGSYQAIRDPVTDKTIIITRIPA